MRIEWALWAASAFAALTLTVPDPTCAEDLHERFSEANARYEQGDYAGAIELYRGVEQDGVADADLFYNLGNAYYKTQDLGHTVLYYERALRLEPRNRDARDNLELVRSQLQDKQFVTQQNRIIRGVIWFHNNLSTREMVIFTSLSWLVMCVIVLALIFRDSRAVRTVYKWLSIASPGRLMGMGMTRDLVLALGIATVLVATSGISSFEKMNRESKRSDGVVLLPEVSVFGSPTGDATLQFRIHSGTMVGIVERRANWVRIRLPGELSGWVETTAVGSV